VTALEASADETAELLDRGVIDVAILEHRRVKPEWTQVPLGEDELVLCVAKSHPLARRSTVAAADLDGLAMAVFDGTFIQRAILEGICKPAGAKPRFVLVSNFVPLIAQAAVDGVGAATLLRALAESVPGLVAVSFEPRQVLRFSLCWRSELYLSNANRAFVEFVKAARI
jgi:DNA-binding transcriptional LysR family regulator